MGKLILGNHRLTCHLMLKGNGSRRTISKIAEESQSVTNFEENILYFAEQLKVH